MLDWEQIRCSAVNLFFEARGEPLACQIKVLDTVYNRVKHYSFENNICDVIKEPRQFSWYKSSYGDLSLSSLIESGLYEKINQESFAFELNSLLASIHYVSKSNAEHRALYYMTIEGYHRIEKHVLSAEFIEICGNHLFFKDIHWR